MSLSKRIGSEYVSQALERILDMSLAFRNKTGDTRSDEKRREKQKKRREKLRKSGQQRFEVAKQAIDREDTVVDRWLGHLKLNKRAQQIYLEEGHSFLALALQRYCFLSDWIKNSTIRADEFVLLQHIEAPNKLMQRFEEWQIGRDAV